jgi:hypothetical protein
MHTHGITVPHGIPWRMGYRGAWDTVAHGIPYHRAEIPWRMGYRGAWAAERQGVGRGCDARAEDRPAHVLRLRRPLVVRCGLCTLWAACPLRPLPCPLEPTAADAATLRAAASRCVSAWHTGPRRGRAVRSRGFPPKRSRPSEAARCIALPRQTSAACAIMRGRTVLSTVAAVRRRRHGGSMLRADLRPARLVRQPAFAVIRRLRPRRSRVRPACWQCRAVRGGAV